MPEQQLNGACLCGGVKFTFKSTDEHLIACHCHTCRIASGHFVVAIHSTDEGVQFNRQEGLKWYGSSDFAKRAFCENCGTQLFYKNNDRSRYSIMVGCIENLHGLTINEHLFPQEKGDYYQIENPSS